MIDVIGHPKRVVNVRGKYSHQFGGRRAIRGLPRTRKAPIHLLYDFDLSDPELAFLEMASSRLPLLYPFRYDGATLAYRIKSEDEVELLQPLREKTPKDFPYAGYPDAFPVKPVSIKAIPYDVHKTLAFAAALDSDHRRLNTEDRKLLKRLRFPFTQLGGVPPLPYGEPVVHCPNRKCFFHPFVGSMHVLATVWDSPVPELSLWGEAGSFTIVVYKICSECKSIFACNITD